MALADRIIHIESGSITGDIPIHEWTSAFTLYAIGEATRNKVINTFSLTSADETGLDALKTTYDGLGTKADKNEFLEKLEAAGIFYQNGTIDTAQYKSIMGL